MTDRTTGRTRPPTRSSELFERARHVMPGGVNSPVRAFAAVGDVPRFMARGAGSRMWDVDDNEYIDFVMSWGPLIHGHAYAPVIDALNQAAASGTSFGAPTEREVLMSELVIEAVPSIEMVRFVNSGTEATMSAVRLARGVTGRDLIVKFAGNYHGHADMLLARAGSGSLTLGIPSSPGVPKGAAESTIVAPYNDVAALEAIFDVRGDEIAAVIVEPIAGNMGVVVPDGRFLRTIRRLTAKFDAVFICDEVITGFRVHFGGAQSLLGFDPDITTLGKIIGGGLPVGAYGGSRAIMEHVAPVGPIYQAGTLAGNPLAMAAGLASLAPLRDPEFHTRLTWMTDALKTGLEQAAESAGAPVCVNAAPGMLTVFFTPHLVRDLAGAEVSDTRMYARFFHAMLERGIYLPPSQFEAWMLSAAHGEVEVEAATKAAAESFAIALQDAAEANRD
jgi:glutamate-1-semialdehyde 2,1-aminomutase